MEISKSFVRLHAYAHTRTHARPPVICNILYILYYYNIILYIILYYIFISFLYINISNTRVTLDDSVLDNDFDDFVITPECIYTYDYEYDYKGDDDSNDV